MPHLKKAALIIARIEFKIFMYEIAYFYRYYDQEG